MLYTAGVLLFVFMGVLGATAIWHGPGSLHWGRFLFRGWILLSLVWVATRRLEERRRSSAAR